MSALCIQKHVGKRVALGAPDSRRGRGCEPCPEGDGAGGHVVAMRTELKALEAKNFERPARDEHERASGDSASAGGRGDPIADVGGVAMPVDDDKPARPESLAVSRVNDCEFGALAAGQLLGGGHDECSPVFVGVRAGHERPARNLGVLAGLDDPLHVVERPRSEADNAVTDRRSWQRDRGHRS